MTGPADPGAARAAERWLEERLVGLLPVDEGGRLRELAVPHRFRDRELLQALAELEVLSAAEAEQWSARLESAWSGPRRRRLLRDHELLGRAREVLGRLLEDVTPFVERPTANGWTYASFSDEPLGAAVRALRAVGVLDAREEDRWTERWSRALRKGAEPPSPAREEPPDEELYEAIDLLAVVPPVELRTDLPARVACAELYADCVSIAWHVVVRQPECRVGQGQSAVTEKRGPRTIARIREVRIELTDDLGTPYRRVGPRGYDLGVDALASTAAWSETVFAPAVPEGATRLEAAVQPGGATMAFKLPR